MKATHSLGSHGKPYSFHHAAARKSQWSARQWAPKRTLFVPTRMFVSSFLGCMDSRYHLGLRPALAPCDCLSRMLLLRHEQSRGVVAVRLLPVGRSRERRADWTFHRHERHRQSVLLQDFLPARRYRHDGLIGADKPRTIEIVPAVEEDLPLGLCVNDVVRPTICCEQAP